MEISLDSKYWDSRYRDNQTGWDIGYPSPPLIEYVEKHADKHSEILIPGGGNAYEASYLFEKGYQNISVLDLSKKPLVKFSKSNPQFPPNQLIHADFFDHKGLYDLILEQTFFCALHPSLRDAYVSKMVELLKPDARLVGVLFDDPLFDDHPPFGGNEKVYREIYGKGLVMHKMERCMNSIDPRTGRELFFIASKS